MPEILQLNDVARKFDGFELRGTSFTLAPGYIMGLIGPNGSGKTTIIKLIMNRKPTDVAQAMEIYFETFSRDKFASYLKQFELPKDKRIKTLHVA